MKKFNSLMLLLLAGVFTAFGQYQQITSLNCFPAPDGTAMTLSFTNTPAPASGGVVTFYFQGDFNSGAEVFEVFDEGLANIGTSPFSSGQCLSTLDSFKINLTVGQLASWTADGVIDFQLDPDGSVSTSLCTPCTGAQAKIEYAPVTGPNDAGVVSLANPKLECPGTYNVDVTITNFGTNQINSVDVDWEIAGVAQPTFTYTGLIDTLNGSNPSSVTVTLGSYAFTGGSYSVKAWTISPNGVADTSNLNDTLNTNFATSISGVYTLDSGQPTGGSNFNSFTDLSNRLNAAGICAPTVVNVAAGTYNDVLNLDNVPGLSAINTLTIDGSDSSIVTLENALSSGTFIVGLKNVPYVTIKNMTIKSTLVSTTDHFGVHLSEGTHHDSLINLHVLVDGTSTSGPEGITASGSQTNAFTEGNNANYTTVMNCHVEGGDYNIHFEGGAAGSWNAGNTFINNTLENADQYGIYLDEQDSVNIMGNSITGIRQVSGYGMYGLDCMNMRVHANYVHAPDYGMYFPDANYDKVSSYAAEFFNNMVISDNDHALYMFDAHNIHFYHNSFNALGVTEAVRIAGVVDSLDVRNNIFNAASSEAFQLEEPDTVFIKFDNNLFNTDGGGNLIDIDGTTYASLAAYKLAQPAYNGGSLEGDPQFLSSTDLHIVGNFVNDAGDNSVGVLEDIDGDTRPIAGATTVDIGADEFVPPTCAPPINISVTNIGLDSVTISWDGGTGTFFYEIVLAGNPQGTGTTAVTSLDSLRIGGLSASTSYDLYVQEICGRGDTSPWIGPLNFNTAIGIPFIEDFEAFTPGITGNPWINGWTSTTTTDPNWESEDANSGANENSLRTGPLWDHTFYGGPANGMYIYMETSSGTNGASADFVSPPIYVQPSQNVFELSYWYFNFGVDVNSMEVIIDSNGVENIVATYNGSQQTSQNDVWYKDSILVSGYGGKSIQIKFRGYNGPSYEGDLAIDDVSLDIVAPIDAAVTSQPEPINDSLQCYTATENVSINILNAGTSALDFTVDPATVTVEVTGAVTQTLTTTINTNAINGGAPLASGSNLNIPLGTIDMTTVGLYDFTSSVTIGSDGNVTNDTLESTINRLPFSGGMIEGNDSICSGDTTTLTTTGYYGTIQWQELIGGTWTNITGADSASIDVDPTANTDYRVVACGTVNSAAITVVPLSLGAPTVNSNMAVVACGSQGTDTLLASSTSTGASFNWYDAPTGGNLLEQNDTLLFSATPGSPTNPSVDTFYVSATNGNVGDTVIPAPHASVYSGNVRGYHFTAPFDFTITGLEVATTAGAGSQSVAVLRTNNNAPWNVWNAAVVPFTTLFVSQNSTLSGYIPANIQIRAGDNIAILGQRGNGNSYSPDSDIIIDGNTIPIQRFIMQNQLGNTLPSNATQIGFEASASISRVNFTYAIGCEGLRTMAIGEVNCVVGLENLENTELFEVYPNPSNGLFTLNVKTTFEEDFNMLVRDVKGKVVYKNAVSVNGVYTESMDFSNLAKGVYYLQVQSENATRVEKLIIQ